MKSTFLKICSLALLLQLSPFLSIAQDNNTGAKKPRRAYLSTGMDGYILSTSILQKNGGDAKLTTPRFTGFFHIGLNINFDFSNHSGFYTGINIKNIGFIEKYNNPDSTVKRRVYTFGIPLGLKFGNLKEGNYFLVGGGVDFPFNFKEKGFIKRSNKVKFNEWFSDRTPTVMPYVFIGAHFGGFRDAMASPLLLDMAIHTFDQARLITGAVPVSVYCHEFNPKGSWYAGNAAAICIFEMSDGSVFNYRGSWCAEGAPTSWEAEWRIVGDQGTAIWDGHNPPYAEVVAPGQEEGQFIKDCIRIDPEMSAFERRTTGHDGCLDEMFLALEESRPAETDCRDNRYSMAMVLAALESASSGRKVMLDTMLRL